MQEKDKIKDLLGNTLRNFEAVPPAGMWDRIESGLQRRKRRILIFRYSSIAASIMLMLGLGIGYLNQPTDSIPDKQPAKSEQTKSKDNPNDKQLANNTSRKDVKTKEAKGKTTNTKSVKKKNSGKSVRNRSGLWNQTFEGQFAENNKRITDQQEVTAPIDHSSRVNQIQHEIVPISDDIADDVIGSENFQIVIPPQIPISSRDLAILFPEENTDTPEEKTHEGNWSLGLAYAVTSGGDFSSESAALDEGGREYSYDEFSVQMANETSYFEEVENAVHDAPLSIGFTVDMPASRRLSFETGLIYTRLKYKVKTNELDPFYREYRNELSYLGVPAGIRYSFIQKKKFDFYALQWVVIEKGISGTWFTDTYEHDVIVSSESDKQYIRGMQLSTVTGIGGQVKVAGKFYLFGQGGAQVFLLNKTQPYNLRSTKNVWPSLQAGLRLNIGK